MGIKSGWTRYHTHNNDKSPRIFTLGIIKPLDGASYKEKKPDISSIAPWWRFTKNTNAMETVTVTTSSIQKICHKKKYNMLSEIYRTIQRLFKSMSYDTLCHSEICLDNTKDHSNICQTYKNVISKICTGMQISDKIICDRYEQYLKYIYRKLRLPDWGLYTVLSLARVIS